MPHITVLMTFSHESSITYNHHDQHHHHHHHHAGNIGVTVNLTINTRIKVLPYIHAIQTVP